VKMLRNDVKKQTEDSSVYVRWDEVAVRSEEQKLGIACEHCGFAS
jgi:DNA-directed RNA polymerase subunit RPC12/RpoP